MKIWVMRKSYRLVCLNYGYTEYFIQVDVVFQSSDSEITKMNTAVRVLPSHENNIFNYLVGTTLSIFDLWNQWKIFKKTILIANVDFYILSALKFISALDRLSSIVGYDVTVNQTLVSSARTRWYNNPYTLGSYSFPAVGKWQKNAS